MSFLSNLHTHTVYCDGKNTIEENIQKAIALGFLSIGISEHGPCVIEELGIHVNKVNQYLLGIIEMKERYNGKIEVYAGFEIDSSKLMPKTGLDYTIGSVHLRYDKKATIYHSVDYTQPLL